MNNLLAYFGRPRTSNGPTSGHQRAPGAPTRHRPGIPQPHALHHPQPHPHRPPQRPTESNHLNQAISPAYNTLKHEEPVSRRPPARQSLHQLCPGPRRGDFMCCGPAPCSLGRWTMLPCARRPAPGGAFCTPVVSGCECEVVGVVFCGSSSVLHVGQWGLCGTRTGFPQDHAFFRRPSRVVAGLPCALRGPAHTGTGARPSSAHGETPPGMPPHRRYDARSAH